MNSLPLIGIVCDVKDIDGARFHAVGEKYIHAVAHGARALPLLIPAFGEGAELAGLTALLEPAALVARLDGLFLPGSPSNVEPEHYAGPSSRPGTLHDPQRDATSLPLIRAALAAQLPLFAVCRGFQELNVALGGSLHQHVHEQPGLMDHREDKARPRDEQYGPAHTVRLDPDGCFAAWLGVAEIRVNSLHGQGLDRLAEGLVAEGVAPDGLVEAVRVRDARFAIGTQWHPEWRIEDNPVSRALFTAFGEAARERAAARDARRASS